MVVAGNAREQLVWQSEYAAVLYRHGDPELAHERANQELALRLRLIAFERVLDPTSQDARVLGGAKEAGRWVTIDDRPVLIGGPRQGGGVIQEAPYSTATEGVVFPSVIGKRDAGKTYRKLLRHVIDYNTWVRETIEGVHRHTTGEADEDLQQALRIVAEVLPSGLLDVLELFYIKPVSEAQWLQVCEKEYGESSESLYGFFIPRSFGGGHDIFLRRIPGKPEIQATILAHEIGHLVSKSINFGNREASWSEGKWFDTWRKDETFDRYTSYSETSAREGFAETFVGFLGLGRSADAGIETEPVFDTDAMGLMGKILDELLKPTP